MWVLTTGETEFFSKVSLQEFVSGEGGQNTGIDSLLVGLSLFRGLKEFSLNLALVNIGEKNKGILTVYLASFCSKIPSSVFFGAAALLK